MRTKDEKAVFADRAAAWNEAYIAPLAAAISLYAVAPGAGQPPAARVYLRDVAPAYSPTIADVALQAVVQAVVRGDGLTATAAKCAAQVAKVTGFALADDRQGVALGYLLIGLVCDVTRAAEIVAKHGARPNKVAGGVTLTPSYELIVTKAAFLEDAARFGSIGMPTYSKTAPTPWTDQKTGGVQGQDHGLVHSAGKQMEDVTSGTAPALYGAANVAQAAEFRVNQAAAAVVLAYDSAAAYGWLLAHYIGKGMDPAKAEAKAREDARL